MGAPAVHFRRAMTRLDPEALAALEAALDALSRGRRGEALDAALNAWRLQRWPRLADLATAIGAEAARALPAIEGATRQAFHAQWLDVANQRRAVDVPRLLDGLQHPPWTRFRERLARLALFPDDPRICLALAAFVEALPVRSSIEAAGWREVFRLLERGGDSRCLARLDRWQYSSAGTAIEDEVIRPEVARIRERLSPPAAVVAAPVLERLEVALAALSSGPPPTPEQLQVAPAPSPRSEAELLAAVHAAPDDDAPRLVFADWLLERGDDRGELITLQFQSAAGSATPAQAKQEARLLKSHLEEWLGALEPVIVRKSVRFEKGFLAAAATDFRTPTQIAELVKHPGWSTLRELQDDGPLLDGGRLPALRAVTAWLSLARAAQVATRAQPLPRLESLRVARGPAADEARARLARGESVPALSSLELMPEAQDELRWLVGTPLAARLRRLVVHDEGLTFRAWWRLCGELPALEELAVGERPHFRFLRDAAGWRLEVSVIHETNRTWAAIERLGGAVKRIVLVPSAADAQLEAVVARRLTQYDVSIAPRRS